MTEAELELDPEEMRRLGYAVVDAVVDRHARLPELSPWQGGTRAEMERLFRDPCPQEPGDATAVLTQAVEEILPLAGRVDHPRFMAFVPSSPVWAAILGDWLATGFSVFQGTWLSPQARARSSWWCWSGSGNGWGSRRAPAASSPAGAPWPI